MNLSNPKETYPKIEKLSCAQKIEELGILTENLPSGPEYADWAEVAASTRSLRNRFAHGTWELYLPTIERPIGLRMPPWINVDSQDKTLKLSIQELEELADEVEECFKAFMRWRNKYKL
jgi:hypothetical protein